MCYWRHVTRRRTVQVTIKSRRMTRVREGRSTVLAGLACTALVCGCARERGGAAAWTTSVDTADGTIRVINTPPEGGVLPTLVGVEERRIGTVEEGGPAAFGLIRSIAVLNDGRIAVGDAQAEEVRLFDRDGRYLRTFGGKGAGPGELRGMQGVYLDHDGLLRVPEQGNGRISTFDPDSGFVGTHPLQLFRYSFRGPWEAAFDSAGRTLVASAGPFQGRSWNMLRVYDATMAQIDSVPYHDYTDDSRRDDRPGVWLLSMRGGQLFLPVPFYARPQEVLSSTGEFWTSVEGQPELEVARWTPPGDTTLVLYSRRLPLPVTAAERDSAMDAVSARLAKQMPGAPKLDASKIPPNKPPLYGLSLDDRGRLWARITSAGADPTVYDVFNRDGGHAETVSLPFAVDEWIPPIVRGDTVWAVATDELNVQYVVRARLRPRQKD